MSSYVIGIGCRRGTTEKKISEAVNTALGQKSLSITQVKCLATCDVKENEEGLATYAESVGLDILFFTSDELKLIDVPNPSNKPQKAVGTPSVAEAAAIKASFGRLVSEKLKFFGLITIAIAEC